MLTVSTYGNFASVTWPSSVFRVGLHGCEANEFMSCTSLNFHFPHRIEVSFSRLYSFHLPTHLVAVLVAVHGCYLPTRLVAVRRCYLPTHQVAVHRYWDRCVFSCVCVSRSCTSLNFHFPHRVEVSFSSLYSFHLQSQLVAVHSFHLPSHLVAVHRCYLPTHLVAVHRCYLPTHLVAVHRCWNRWVFSCVCSTNCMSIDHLSRYNNCSPAH